MIQGFRPLARPDLSSPTPPPGARALHEAFVEGVGAKISAEKLALVCSSRQLWRGLAKALGGLAGPVVDSSSAANLGVDDTAGRSRRCKGRSA